MQFFDLIIIGTGSGNSVLNEDLAHLNVAIVEGGKFGGTCLNAGCIPTKMMVYPADLADSPAAAARVNVDLTLDSVDFPALRDRVFGRIDAIEDGGRQYRKSQKNVTVFESKGRFTGDHQFTLETGEVLEAKQFVIAAGAHTDDPGIEGLEHYQTSETVMRMDRLPRRMVVIGSGFVAMEFAHVFSAFGVEVTVLARKDAVLRAEDEQISRAITEEVQRAGRIRLLLNTAVLKVAHGSQSSTVYARGPEGPVNLVCDQILVATGRTPNGRAINAEATGVKLDGDRIVVDEHQRTAADGIYALGDVCSPAQLKHVANAEARTVQYNLLHPDSPMKTDHRAIPHGVFTEPQIAGVGMTEAAARKAGHDVTVAVQKFGDTAFGWAMEDQHSICKIVADRSTKQILGAHLMGPNSTILIQPLIMAMSMELPYTRLARSQYWIHPALSEVIENALLQLDGAQHV